MALQVIQRDFKYWEEKSPSQTATGVTLAKKKKVKKNAKMQETNMFYHGFQRAENTGA